MRVTKKVVAKAINEWFDTVEMPYSVLPENIERTYFTPNEYEGGATHHFIVAKHKEDINYSDMTIFTMQSMKSMQDELNRFKGTKITIQNYGSSRHMMDYWLVIK